MLNRELSEAFSPWALPLTKGSSFDALDLATAPLVVRKIATKLKNHFPDVSEQYIKIYVTYLAMVMCDPFGFLSRWEPEAQRRYVNQIQSNIDRALTDIDELSTIVAGSFLEGGTVSALQRISSNLKDRKHEALRLAKAGLKPDRRNWMAIACAISCSNVWFDATSTLPPKTVDADAPGPFGRFLQDVLDLFQISSSSRSALRAMPDHLPIKLISNGNEEPA